jgi:hypothetical protein
MSAVVRLDDLDLETQDFYRQAIRVLNAARIPFLCGGAYGLAQYTGIVRHTKDLDIFLRAADAPRALGALAAAGYRTELTFRHWLGKAFSGTNFVDVIFSSGNGIAKVDNLWFAHAQPARFLGEEIRLCPIEEMIWSKAYVLERERYDGADISHLIRAAGRDLDWPRLLRRFGSHWRVLLSHLVLFEFIYPSDRDAVPGPVMQELLARGQQQTDAPVPRRRVCRGTLLSRIQYEADLDRWGYADARLAPESGMTPQQISAWTAAGLNE